jgi:hypothetical protein
MGRTLDALRALESRRGETAVTPPRSEAAQAAAIVKPVEKVAPPPTVPVQHPVPAHHEPTPAPAFEKCSLPTTPRVAEHYLETAGRIGEQLSANYCNVLLLATLDHACESCFSITQLAQAFVVQSPGRLLLVDGDLRMGKLTKTVIPSGLGIIEVMLGIAQWRDVIHPTTVAGVDFVGAGHAQVPTLDRPDFGWAALRPSYRIVLIGMAPCDEPETRWLAARCDGVYLVLSRPHSKRQTAIVAVNALRACGANPLGCIVADG